MLITVQSAGDRPPLFFVHGNHGIMTLGSTLAREFGPRQPIYAIHAEGIDGRTLPVDNMQEMIAAYAAQVQAVRPKGTLRVGGMCWCGCLAATELARELQKHGRETGSVILVDPSTVVAIRPEKEVDNSAKPAISEKLYQMAREAFLMLAESPENDIPFDMRDPNQLHTAVLAGLGVLMACNKFVRTPFDGPVEVILSEERAAGFFHPQMPARKLLPGPRKAHVVPWNHHGILGVERGYTARLIKFMLDDALNCEVVNAG